MQSVANLCASFEHRASLSNGLYIPLAGDSGRAVCLGFATALQIADEQCK